MAASVRANCSRPLGLVARIRGATYCGACEDKKLRESQETYQTAASVHMEHAWGHHIDLPTITDRQMRQLIQKVASAMPRAAAAEDETSRREAVESVWPDPMECAAHMNGTPTSECSGFVSKADALSEADRLLALLAPDDPNAFRTFWRLWWTAALRLGRPVQIAHLADEALPPDDVQPRLERLCALAYAYHYRQADLAGTDWAPGYVAFVDCEGCQRWRADRRLSS